jgi:hypothetical protein
MPTSHLDQHRNERTAVKQDCERSDGADRDAAAAKPLPNLELYAAINALLLARRPR